MTRKVGRPFGSRTLCAPECACKKHTLRNSGQWGAKRLGGFFGTHSEATRAVIKAKRAAQTNLRAGGPAPLPPEQRFYSKVQKKDGCWEWMGAKNHGYGAFMVGSSKDGTRKIVRAHRWVWEQVNGEVPAGRELDHLCGNRSCVNPGHLEPVTHEENIKRALQRQGVP